MCHHTHQGLYYLHANNGTCTDYICVLTHHESADVQAFAREARINGIEKHLTREQGSKSSIMLVMGVCSPGGFCIGTKEVEYINI
jgi:hypothetical protein